MFARAFIHARKLARDEEGKKKREEENKGKKRGENS